MITGKTKLVGILGWPVEHSISPAIQNAAFSARKLDYTYVPLPAKPGYLKEAIDGLRSMGFVGANVTIPHKVEIIPYLDEVDRSARMIGAVNTIVIRDGRCIGYNTDAAGFIQSLNQNNIAVQGKNAVILGAGGAARAVVCGLLDNGISRITLGARNTERAADFAQYFDKITVTGSAWSGAEFDYALHECDLLINCTPLGMYPKLDEEPPLAWDSVNKKAAVCDLIYNPGRTKFLTHAAQLGHTVLSGEGMLIEQGALAFQLWTEVDAPRNVMRSAFEDGLR